MASERTFAADEVRETLDRLLDEEISHTENVSGTLEAFAREVVEEGTFWPDCRVEASITLPLRERITGRRSQDVTAMLCIGLVLASALERDVPMNSALENAWRDGAFELPDRSGDSERDRVSEHFSEGIDRAEVELVDRNHWRHEGTDYILGYLPSQCNKCGESIPEESAGYVRDGPWANDGEGGMDEICWDCGQEVTGFGE